MEGRIADLLDRIVEAKSESVIAAYESVSRNWNGRSFCWQKKPQCPCQMRAG
jgi:hypothetical protein